MPLVLRAKCIVVGDSTVGKSALTQNFASDGTHFAKSYNMTTGVDVCVKAVHLPDTDATVELYIHDSAGKEVFSDFVPQFWDHPSVVMVVYDVTSEQSFASCAKWLERVKVQRPGAEVPLPGALVANKVDLGERRVVGVAEGRSFAQSKDLQYFECSAKQPDNVEKPFLYLAQQFYQLYEDRAEAFKTLA